MCLRRKRDGRIVGAGLSDTDVAILRGTLPRGVYTLEDSAGRELLILTIR